MEASETHIINLLLQRYALGHLDAFKNVGRSSRRRVFRVETDKGTFIISEVAQKFATIKNIEDRVALLNFLVSHRFPVPRPHRDKEGKYIQQEAGAYFFVEDFVLGTLYPQEANDLTPTLVQVAGENLAHYHRLMRMEHHQAWNPCNNQHYHPDSFFSSQEATELWQRVLTQEESHMEADSFLIILSKKRLKELKKNQVSIETLNKQVSLLRRELCHGDYRPANLVFRNDTIVGVLDWEFARELPRCWEIIRAACCFSKMRGTEMFNSKLDLSRFELFIRSYHNIEPLDVEEAKLMPEMAYLGALCPFYFLIAGCLQHDPTATPLLPLSLEECDWWRVMRKKIHGLLLAIASQK